MVRDQGTNSVFAGLLIGAAIVIKWLLKERAEMKARELAKDKKIFELLDKQNEILAAIRKQELKP